MAGQGGRGMNDRLIEVQGVTKAFGGVIANNDITLDVPKGRITGLIGPNGSGKTTFFNVVTGIYAADHGSVAFTGRDITNISGATLSVRAVNRGMKKALALVEALYRVPALASAGRAPSAQR